MDIPKVSVCIPVYRNSTLIKETVDSILNQTYKNFEIILVDDGSEDNDETWNVISSFGGPVRAFKQKNTGIAGAKNTCVNYAKGELIAFCDHDDLWKPTKLEKQVKILDENPDLDFVFSSFTRFSPEEGELKTLPKGDVDKDIFSWMLPKSYMLTSTLILRKTTWDTVGPYNTTFKLADDYEFMLRLSHASKGYFIKESLVLYRIYQGNTSRSAALKSNYPKEKIRIYKYWLSCNDLSNSQQKSAKKRLGKCYFDLALYAQKKKNLKKYQTLLCLAKRYDPYNRRYLFRILKNSLKLLLK